MDTITPTTNSLRKRVRFRNEKKNKEAFGVVIAFLATSDKTVAYIRDEELTVEGKEQFYSVPIDNVHLVGQKE